MSLEVLPPGQLNNTLEVLPPTTPAGGGGGTVTSITATAPVVAAPSPIIGVGVISITDFVASGASHARGSVPDPGAVAGTTKFLREDATWAVPPGTGGTSSFDWGKYIAGRGNWPLG